jgi:hypothetical protein
VCTKSAADPVISVEFCALFGAGGPAFGTTARRVRLNSALRDFPRVKVPRDTASGLKLGNVPEIKNEIPSDVELRAYLDESQEGWSFSMLLQFPKHQVHYRPEVVEALGFLKSHSICNYFLDSAYNTLYEALKRLNRLSRDDPFWKNTNRRPTIFKLTEYSDRVLSASPNDSLSILTRATLDVAFVGEFHPDTWTTLFRLNVVDLEFVMFAAMLLEISGAPDADGFASFIVETATPTKARQLLWGIAIDGGKILADWSDRITELLDEDNVSRSSNAILSN